MNTSIIAIDPSLNFTGWCINTNGKRISSGVIRTKGESVAEKLSLLAAGVESVIIEHDNRLELPLTVAVIEIPAGFSYNRSTGRFGKQLNVEALLKLSRAVGVVLLVCWKKGLRCVEVEATHWKGRMGKKTATYIAGVSNNNEADAILLSEYYHHVMALKSKEVS